MLDHGPSGIDQVLGYEVFSLRNSFTPFTSVTYSNPASTRGFAPFNVFRYLTDIFFVLQQRNQLCIPKSELSRLFHHVPFFPLPSAFFAEQTLALCRIPTTGNLLRTSSLWGACFKAAVKSMPALWRT